MADHRLNVVQIENIDSNNTKKRWGQNPSKREETQARFERQWLIDPHQFDPARNCLEIERIQRSLDLLTASGSVRDSDIVDLGAGWGDFSAQLQALGAKVLAVDIASNALKNLKSRHPEVVVKQDFVPKTTLDDEKYDYVAALDLIAYLPKDDHRLFFAEVSRLVKANGKVLCSTPLDLRTEDAVQAFADLAETEFQIEHWALSYHLCFLYLLDFLEAPKKFYKGSIDKEYHAHEIGQRKGFSKIWFRLNSSPGLAWFWRGVSFIINPLSHWFKHSKSMMTACERFCKTFWDTAGVSHAIFIGKRRSLIIPQVLPEETKHKKEVWE